METPISENTDHIPYTYVFVRTDLTAAQQIVQAAHATYEAGWKFEKTETPLHLILFGVKNEEELIKASERIGIFAIDHCMFFEPDLPGWTAIATMPIYGEHRSVMKKYQLYLPDTDAEKMISA
jgi:hypothetical protein